MKNLFLLTFLFLTSCSNSPETETQFVERFEAAIKENDNKALKNCFINTKKEITKLHDLVRADRKNKNDDSFNKAEIEEFYQELQEEMKTVHHDLIRKTKIDWSIESHSSFEFEKVSADEIELPDGYRGGILKIMYDNVKNPFYIKLDIVDLNTGKWKIIDEPRVRTK